MSKPETIKFKSPHGPHSNEVASKESLSVNTLKSANNSKFLSNIISLSKLKNYMPQNTDSNVSRLFKYERPKKLVNDNISGFNYNLAIPRRQATEFSSVSLSADQKGGQQQTAAVEVEVVKAATALDQLRRSLTQQESEQPQKQSETTISSGQTSFVEGWEKVESSEATNRLKLEEEQQQYPLVLDARTELKRKRIEKSTATYLGFKDIQVRATSSKANIGSCGKNNMTPSSLLLIQNRNYIERHQHQLEQQRREQEYSIAGTNYNTSIGFDTSSLKTIANLEYEHINRQANENAKQSIDRRNRESTDDRETITSSLNYKLPPHSAPSSSLLMPSDTNHFKIAASQDSNPSGICADVGGYNNNKIASKTETSSYLPQDEDINLSLSHQLSNSNSQNSIGIQNNFQTNYNNQHHQGLSYEGFRGNPISNVQAVSYNSINQRSQPDSYYQRTINQTLKLDNSSDNVESISNGLTQSKIAGPNLNVTNLARNFAPREQGSAPIDQYYSGSNSHYNFMPTSSSKSSSPHSNSSSPSPKASKMQTISASQNTTEQVTSVGLNNNNLSSINVESHLDQLNHHYSNTIAVGSNPLVHHHHDPMSQHYSYSHQSTSGSNQHQLSAAPQDQAYAQQQHQHIQHHHQHHHHHQQQQQHLQSNADSQQQSIYDQIATGSVLAGASNSSYSQASNGIHYHGHLQSNSVNHQTNNLMNEAHQSHLNTAAAACAAAAVVSQTLKTVANQHNQHHHGNHHHRHYGSHSMTNGFGTTTGGLINMTAHHQQFHNASSIGPHHLNQSASIHQQQQQAQQNQHNGNNTSNHNQHHQLHHQPTQQDRQLHQAVSVVTRKYQCKMCPQVFMSKAEMKYHNQNHMREAKPYKCLQCPKAFANSSYLSQHMRIHQGVKPYTCDVCTRKFTQLSHLQQHKRTHTGDKPYKCQYPNCTKQFSQLSNLQSHSRCHQLDKPYKCNSCYKCFQDEQSLLEHIPRHLESKHLKKNLCIFCGSSYQQERGLVKHFQQYHTDKTPTLVAAAIGAGTTGNTSLIASLISSTQTGVFATPSSGSASSSSSSTISSSSSSNSSNGSSGGGGNSSASSTTSTTSTNSNGNISLGNTTNGNINSHSANHTNSAMSGYQLGGSFF